MSRWLWYGRIQWASPSQFRDTKSKSGSSTTGHIPLRESLIFPHMKSRSKLTCAHPFLTHWKIRNWKNLIFCSVFTSTVYFEEVTTSQMHFHLALGFTRKNYWKIFLRPGSLLDIFLASKAAFNISWIFFHPLWLHSIYLSNKCLL